MTLECRQGPILVVDGDARDRQACQGLLELAGHSALAAAGAAEAGRLAGAQEPALTILDVTLPDGDGLALLHDLRAAWPAMPTIVVTRHAEAPRIVEAMRAGAFDYLTKPVDPEALLATCRMALARREGAGATNGGHPGEERPTGPWSATAGRLRPLREIEDAYIDHVLHATGGNRTRAARILGVARETLRTRILTRRAAS
jgi:DNA-binding NtrC family response regulator